MRRQPLGGGAQRARGPAVLVLVVHRALAAREDLVPGAGQGQLALDEQRVLGGRGDVVAQRAGGELGLDRGVGAGLEPDGRRAGGVAQARDGVREDGLLRRGAADLGERALEDEGALLEHQLGVDVGLHLDRRVVLPGAVGVGPALDAVGPPAGAVGGDPRLPRVEPRVGAGHRQDVLGAVGVGEHDGGVDGVVALAEHGGRDVELLVDDGLGGAGAAVDGRPDVEDGDAADRVLGGTGLRGCSHGSNLPGPGPAGHVRGTPRSVVQDPDEFLKGRDVSVSTRALR